MDPIGNIPLYISILKGMNPKRQRVIILRELVVALAIIIVFAFLGNGLMDFLKIECATIQIAGGLILFLLCLKMIFPPPHETHEIPPHNETEPFIVPLAVPLVAGPGVLAAVMIFAQQETHPLVMVGAILIAWIASLLILLCSSFLKRILGAKGIIALERLMGLILILISVQMFLSGLGSFLQRYHSIAT
jgi:MarC family membrane protein